MRLSANPLLLQALAIEIKVQRTILSWTQGDLAKRTELNRPYISAIEISKKQPTISVLNRIAVAFDMSLAVFCGHVEQRYLKLKMAQTTSQP